MALYDQRDQPAQVDDPAYARHAAGPALSTGAVLVFVAAVIAVLMIAVFYPGGEGRVGDTSNSGPTVQTVTPAPSPTTEPRPTQAPQP